MDQSFEIIIKKSSFGPKPAAGYDFLGIKLVNPCHKPLEHLPPMQF